MNDKDINVLINQTLPYFNRFDDYHALDQKEQHTLSHQNWTQSTK